MKRLLVLLVLVVVTACYGQEGSEAAGGDAATGEAPPTADTLEVTPDTIMARDTAH